MTQESKEPRFIETGLNSIITESALALVGVKDGEWAALGTCVVIGGSFGITAKHVIQYYFSTYEHVKKFKGGYIGVRSDFSKTDLRRRPEW